VVPQINEGVPDDFSVAMTEEYCSYSSSFSLL
jgi:hypothetical protein